MSNPIFQEIIAGLYRQEVVPYLGPGVLSDVSHQINSTPIPADSVSLILAMNGGKPMAQKLMYEFPRAAMNQELKRGRNFVSQFLDKVYSDSNWSRALIHEWIKAWKPHYVIDVNRDTQLQDSFIDKAHILIVGLARISGTHYRFKLFHYDGSVYSEIDQTQVDGRLPILFKPMGTPKPESNYIASDADYVDYITELMGGFAIPDFLKQYRLGKKYVLLGLALNRDTERMVMSDITYGANESRGWFLRKDPTDKEKRFAKKLGLQWVDADCWDLLEASHKVGAI